MNLRTTPLLCGLLLGMLWLFGLMLAYKRGVPDESLILPSLNEPEVKTDKIESVQFQFAPEKGKERPEILFVQDDGYWYLQQGGQRVRVEGFRVKGLIQQVQEAKRYEEEATSADLADKGLASPKITVTLKGKVKDAEKTWKLNLGNETADKFTVYVNSSDRSNRAFPVARSSLDKLFFKDAAGFRSQRLFDSANEASTNLIDIKKSQYELLVKKSDAGLWMIEKPALGFAGTDAPDTTPPHKFEMPEKKEEKAGSVRGLIKDIGAIHVKDESDFLPLDTNLAQYGVEKNKEPATMSAVQVATGSAAKEAKKDDKDKKDTGTSETLLIGKKEKSKYYARMTYDDGVFLIDASYVDPLIAVVMDPGKVRSKDVAAFDSKNVDAVVIDLKEKKLEFKLLKPAADEWKVYAGSDKARKANEKAVQALLEAVQGKKAIVDFYDGKDPKWGGLDAPNTIISVYADGLAKKDEKKDDKGKKDEKKDEKKETAPAVNKDKVVVTLAIGTMDKDTVHVKRTLPGDIVTRFTISKAAYEKLNLDTGYFPYLDTATPSVTTNEVAGVTIKRGKETIEVVRKSDTKGIRFTIKDPKDTKGRAADTGKVLDVVNGLAGLHVQKWVAQVDDKSDLKPYGLDDPQVTVTLYVKPDTRIAPVSIASLLGALPVTPAALALPDVWANREADPGEPVTFKFGKETDNEKDKPAVFGKHSGSDLVFLITPKALKHLKETDFRDLSELGNTQARTDAVFLGLAAAQPANALFLMSPPVSGAVHSLDPARVTELKLTIRDGVERRKLYFLRTGKDKDVTWWDKTGLDEFTVDTDKVKKTVEELCKLKTERFASFGGVKDEYKLSPKEATVQAELVFDDKTSVTISVGTVAQGLGYLAHSTAWPQAVFFVPHSTIDPLQRGVSYFGKERVGGP